MSRLPVCRPKDVLRALARIGFYVDHSTGSHRVLKCGNKPGLLVVVPWHGKDLKRGTLRAIIDNAGLTVDEFIALL